EERRNHAWNQRFDFTDDDALDARVEDKRTGGHTGAETDHEHGVRIGMHQRRHVAEHPLQSHVVNFCGRFDLAADVEVADAPFGLRDGYRGVETFGFVEVTGALECRDLTAVRDHVRRHWRDGGGRDAG